MERDGRRGLTTRPALREAYLNASAATKDPLAAVIAERIAGHDPHTARVLAASAAAAVRVALERWLRPAGPGARGHGLVVASGSLPDLLRTSLAPLAPALNAAGETSP